MNVGSGKTIAVNEIADLMGGERVYIPKRPGKSCVAMEITKMVGK